MKRDVLDEAWAEMRRRHFGQAIKLLEDRADIYEDNAEYYILTGIACLYVGDAGAAVSYFTKARRIKLTDTRLLLGQAAIYLRRGDTERALQYYLEVLENEPANKTAKDAMEFIRVHGDYDTICRWVDTGRIEQFYPPLGINPDKILYITAGAVALILGCFVGFKILYHPKNYIGPRMDLTNLALSDNEKSNAQENDLSGQAYHYILSNKEINKSYDSALKYFQTGRDNMCQIEVNRILNSNASVSIKTKSRVLMSYLQEPTFDSIVDVPVYTDVAKEPVLYMDCYVSWGGRIANVSVQDGFYSCDFLVGYEKMDEVKGIVTLVFDSVPQIENEKPVTVLGKLTLEDGKVLLRGKAVYQSVKF